MAEQNRAGGGQSGEMPLVSIVTPSYNQGPFLEETIQSVLSQDYPRIEYLVIDGGSTDSSIDVIRKHAAELAHWVSEPDRGQSHAINKGLARATGQILGWINSDDTLLPGTVRRAVEAMEAGPTVVHGGVQLVDAEGRVIVRPKLSKRKREFGLKTIVDDGLVNQPGTFWNRPAMDGVGLLNEDLNYIMDYELWVRMALAGARFKLLGDPPLATYRLTSDTKTVGAMYKMGLEKLALLERLMSDPQLPAKTGLSPQELARQARRAGALAGLKVARGYARLPGHRRDALRWLLWSARRWPPSLLLFPEYLARHLALAAVRWRGKEPPSW